MIVSTSMGLNEPFTKVAQNGGKAVSPELQNLILRKLSDPRTSARELVAMAELCQREGAIETSKALRARAAEKIPPTAVRPRADAAGLALPVQVRGQRSEQVRGQRSEAPDQNAEEQNSESPNLSPLTSHLVPGKAVIPGVEHDRWMTFEKAMVRQEPSEVEPSGRLGMFAMAPRRLVDLGIVAETAKGPDGKWAVSKWTESWSAEKFLGDPKIQQKAFRKSMREYARTIGALYKSAIGKKVMDKPATLSGLLAVAHVAGARGLGSWLSDKTVREKFPQTTRVFLNTTGMF